MSSTNEQSKVTSTSTRATEIATAPTTLDACPDEILINIAEFTGAHSCYLGYGAVNKRINQLFNTYNEKLSKSSSYGGYAPFQEIVEKCEKELKCEIEYEWWNTVEIFRILASGAITFNRTDLLEWAIEKKNKFIHKAICMGAVRYKNLSIFEKVWDSIENENVISYMKQQTVFICIAAFNGYLDWLVYLREKLECEWDERACSNAASGGHLNCLKYLNEQGCPRDEWACRGAACGGRMDCLKYLREQGCEWNEDVCSDAATYGHLNCLKYLHEHGCEWDKWAFMNAAGGGHLDCLRYLHEHGCEWNKGACAYAARGGHLHCLKYLHEQVCPWDKWACREAAENGHLNCLKYLHEHGCEWNKDACKYAVYGGHLDCLQYMRDNGLEWDEYDKYLGSIAQGSSL